MEKIKKEVPTTTPELEKLFKERKALNWRMYRMLFEGIVIFGAPAGIGVYVGLKYNALFLALGAAFVVSWLIFFTAYNQILKKVREVEEKIKEERKRAGIPEPEAPGYPEEDEDERKSDEKGDQI